MIHVKRDRTITGRVGAMTNIDWRATALARTVNLRRRLLRQAIVLGAIVAFLWAIEVVDALFLRGALDGFGIQPRTFSSLPAIVVAPWLHAGFGHLLANTVPFVVLGWLVMMRRTTDLFVVGLTAALVSGLGIWLFGGAHTVHLGISGVIFGLLGYLLARGYYERSITAVALAVFALFLYGGMLWGVLPLQQGISWQGHLFGFAGGILAAYVMVGKKKATVALVPPAT
jgi:membrane associated rhomboid family serine protease